jgi:hypothetical protein
VGRGFCRPALLTQRLGHGGSKIVKRKEASSTHLIECGSPGDSPFQAMHRDLAGGLVLSDLLPCRHHEADDFDPLGLKQNAGFRGCQRRSKRANVDYVSRLRAAVEPQRPLQISDL